MNVLKKLGKLRDPEIRAKNVRALYLAARELAWYGLRPALRNPIFVVGCSRSGTTVTYATLARAPGLISLGYETPQLWHRIWGPWHNGWESEAARWEDARPEHARAARRFWWARLGGGRLLDKTCINTLRVDYLAHLFPDAHFVYVHRDGRSNISSLIDGWRNGDHFALSKMLGPFPEQVAIENGRYRDWCFFLPPGWREYNRASLADVCAYQWMAANQRAIEGSEKVDESRWHPFRYEDLLQDPVGAFAALFSRLGLEYTDQIREQCASLSSHPTSMVTGPPDPNKWRERNGTEIEAIMPKIGEMQRRLGYPDTLDG